MEILKPYLKYLTTVDFGKTTYKSQFEEFLAVNHLKPTLHERCSGNFFSKLFKFYIYEVEAKDKKNWKKKSINRFK